MSQRRRRQVIEEEPLLFDLPLAAPPPADRRAPRAPSQAPVQVGLFSAESELDENEEIDDEAALLERGDHDEEEREARPDLDFAVAAAADQPSGPVVAGVTARFFAGCADAVLHLGVLGGAYLGVIALDVEPGPQDWPAFATLLVAFSFLSSVVSLAFWGQTAGMAWRRLQTRDRLQRPLTFRQAALRWAGGMLTFATAGLPLLFTLGGASLADWMSRSVTYSMTAPAPHRQA